MEEERNNDFIFGYPAMALANQETQLLPDELDYASIVEGILLVTPDIEEEIADADCGKTVQMDEFKTMFAKWL
ncbi:MAG: hypothetical protein K6F96_06420 [Bacteroidales bacterium]|nr:hypothetical protein [Bacteroidales bacterium]